MKYSKTLQTRLIGAFTFTTFTITILYGILVYNAMEYTEDDILTRRVELESQRFIEQYLIDPTNVKLPNSFGLAGYLSTSPDLPGWLVNEPPGTRELHDREVHIGVTRLPNSNALLYIVLNEFDASSLDQEISTLVIILAFVGALITAIGLMIGSILSKFISTPLIQLTNEVDQNDGENPMPFSGTSRSDEVGALSRAFTNAMRQLRDFLQREKQFTRYASHELRTPVALIRNSLAILKLPDQTPDRQQNNLQRIENATVDMDSLIKTFLMLGRKESSFNLTSVDISVLLKVCIAKNRIINPSRTLDIETNIEDSVLINANPELISVLIDNLVRNLYKYSLDTARVELTPDYLLIENNFESLKEIDLSGTVSYGMEIIEKISLLCLFETTITTKADHFKVILDFGQAK